MADERKASTARVLADMASLGMGGELRKMRYRRPVAPAADAEMAAANKREVKRGKAKKAPKRKDDPSAKAVSEHVRNKPTPERIARGAFERVDLARFDTGREGDKVLLDWRARAGGVGEMYIRGQITRRMADAAAKLMDDYELSQSSQLSCSQVKERVEGGMVDLSGARLVAASEAWGAYQSALGRLSRWGRILVEKRVVEGRPMEEIVMLAAMAEAVGAVSVRRRCEKANVIMRGALDHLADVYHLPGG